MRFGWGLGLSRKQRLHLSNRMQQRWADAFTERLWRMKVWMRQQEKERGLSFDEIRDKHLSQLPREVHRR